MIVQNASSQPNFEGKLIKINLNQSSRRILNLREIRINQWLKDKHYNLYVSPTENGELKFIAQRACDYGKKNRPIMEIITAFQPRGKKIDPYYMAANYAINEFDKFKTKPSLGFMIKKSINNLGEKLYKLLANNNK